MKHLCLCLFLLLLPLPAAAQDWMDVKIHLLPDSSFAVVETDAVGRKYRHCPYREADGTVDADQLIWVLGSLERESWQNPAQSRQARQVLERHYQKAHRRLMDSPEPLAVDLNQATPSQLARLPGIGPVLAVRIIEHRQQKAPFETPEDIMKIDGIDRNKFAAIRHYIEVR